MKPVLPSPETTAWQMERVGPITLRAEGILGPAAVSPKLCGLWNGATPATLAGPRGLRASKEQPGYYAWLFLSTDSFSPPPGPRRRLEIEQSQPVSGEQSAAPTRGSAETAADAGVARGLGGARRGCHGPGPLHVPRLPGAFPQWPLWAGEC